MSFLRTQIAVLLALGWAVVMLFAGLSAPIWLIGLLKEMPNDAAAMSTPVSGGTALALVIDVGLAVLVERLRPRLPASQRRSMLHTGPDIGMMIDLLVGLMFIVPLIMIILGVAVVELLHL